MQIAIAGCSFVAQLHRPGAECRRSCLGLRRNARTLIRRHSTFTEKRREPCEPTTGSLNYMGLCMALSSQEAEDMLSKDEVQGWELRQDDHSKQVQGWELRQDDHSKLQLLKRWKTRNFMKALELCNRLGETAENEQHHPDLHITGWNNVEVRVWTHAQDGLTENDFILAAKLNSVPKEDLLQKPKKKLADA